jgi:hypothetical protein
MKGPFRYHLLLTLHMDIYICIYCTTRYDKCAPPKEVEGYKIRDRYHNLWETCEAERSERRVGEERYMW